MNLQMILTFKRFPTRLTDEISNSYRKTYFQIFWSPQIIIFDMLCAFLGAHLSGWSCGGADGWTGRISCHNRGEGTPWSFLSCELDSRDSTDNRQNFKLFRHKKKKLMQVLDWMLWRYLKAADCYIDLTAAFIWTVKHLEHAVCLNCWASSASPWPDAVLGVGKIRAFREDIGWSGRFLLNYSLVCHIPAQTQFLVTARLHSGLLHLGVTQTYRETEIRQMGSFHKPLELDLTHSLAVLKDMAAQEVDVNLLLSCPEFRARDLMARSLWLHNTCFIMKAHVFTGLYQLNWWFTGSYKRGYRQMGDLYPTSCCYQRMDV